MVHIISAAATHVGRVRSQNEDSHYCGRTVFVVADGLGGHAAGEVASALAVEPFAALDGRDHGGAGPTAEALADAVRSANQAVLQAAEKDRAKTGMGTTLTAAVAAGDLLVLAHVGDSRAYLLRSEGRMEQLTTDHTAAQAALEAGVISPAEAMQVPERHMLARAVGLDPDVEVDLPEPVGLEPGDRVLLCSDGLTEAVAERDIAAVLAGTDDLAALTERLVDAALAGGGPDNVTVVILEGQEDSS